MQVTLVPIDAVDASSPLRLTALPAIIGRSPTAAVQLADRWASRHHCQLDQVDGRLRVRDLESKHGTFVNDQPVRDSVLMPGDKLTVGMTSFDVEYDASSAGVMSGAERTGLSENGS